MKCNVQYRGRIEGADLREIVAQNRGLPVDWCKRTFHMSDVNSPDTMKSMNTACKVIRRHIQDGSKILIIVDCDVDGFCSAAMMYKLLCKCGVQKNVQCAFHTGKAHGLTEDIQIPEDVRLVIVPDAGTNDVDECLNLWERGCDVVCLDHHPIECENPHAIVVNCRDGQYANPSLCGAGVVWQFIRQFSSYYKEYICDDMPIALITYAAIATIADMVDVTNQENAYIIQEGLKQSTCIAASEMMMASGSCKLNYNVADVQFKIAPLLNACIRVGTQNDKEALFDALADKCEYASKESVYEKAARLCKNAKARQDRKKKKVIDLLETSEYDTSHTVDISIYSDSSASALTGMIANHLAGKRKKPQIVLRPDDKDQAVYVGSIRNTNPSAIASLKDYIEATGRCEYVRGHENSAGICVKGENIEILQSMLDAGGSDFPAEPVFTVDFELWDSEYIGATDTELDNFQPVDFPLIAEIDSVSQYNGTGFPEVTAYVHSIRVAPDTITVMGKGTSWKVKGAYDASYVCFHVGDDDEVLNLVNSGDDYCAYIDAVCSFAMNEYKGGITPQCIVRGYEITHIERNNPVDDFLM